MRRIALYGVFAATLAMSGCASWSPEAKGTAIGAGAGAAVGNVITGGGTLGTIGGAAAGAIIGHEAGKEQKKR
jgi:osmotically inducible lipoprotein OsmB